MSNYYCSHGNTIAIIATIGEQEVPPHIIMKYTSSKSQCQTFKQLINDYSSINFLHDTTINNVKFWAVQDNLSSYRDHSLIS